MVKEAVSEQPPTIHLTGTLKLLAHDLAEWVAPFAEFYTTPLPLDRLVPRLKEIALHVHTRLPLALSAARMMEGNSFDNLTFEQQMQSIYDLSDIERRCQRPEDQTDYRGYIMEPTVETLYFLFQKAKTDKEARMAWEQFCNAYRVSSTKSKRLPIEDGELISFRGGQFPVLYPNQTLFLPRIANNGSTSNEKRRLLNTHLQDTLAHATGILSNDQNFSQFVESGSFYTIRDYDWPRFHMMREQYPHMPIAMLNGARYYIQGSSVFVRYYEDTPDHFSNLPTRYPGITADVRFTEPHLLENKRRPLADLIESGLSTPRMSLSINTKDIIDNSTVVR